MTGDARLALSEDRRGILHRQLAFRQKRNQPQARRLADSPQGGQGIVNGQGLFFGHALRHQCRYKDIFI